MPVYGSSRIISPNIIGVTGNTGNTGPTGSTGNQGNIGNTGNTGNTGPSIVGMTLTSNQIVTEFTDGTLRSSPNIIGQTGNYVIFADGNNLSGVGLNLFYGLSLENGEDSQTYNLNIRGLTTSSQNSTTKTIEIVSDPNNKHIGITYNLRNISYIGISAGSQPELLIYNSGFRGLTGTAYDKNARTVDLQTTNYGERVHFVSPIKKDVTGTASIYFYWPIDWKQGNIFKLGSYSDQIPVGKTVIAQILLIENPVDTTNAYGVTVIVPSGITSSNSVFTGYATTTNVINGVTLAHGQNVPSSEDVKFSTISWPLGYAPCLTSNTDVITSVFIDGIWYSNFGVYNKQYTSTDTIDIDETIFDNSYLNCSGSKPPDNPKLEYVKCCNEQNGICDTVPADTCSGIIIENCNTCSVPPVVGTCCEICTGTSSPTVQSGCTNDAFHRWTNIANDPKCTDPDGPISTLGICCYKNTTNEIIKHPIPITDCQCSQLANNNNTNKIWTPIDLCNLSVDAIDCTNAFNNIGACCDGKGVCTQTMQVNCLKYWQGKGKVCSYSSGGEQRNRCSSGPSACCLDGNCSPSSSQSSCGGDYYGCGYTCGDFPCVSSGGGGGGGNGGCVACEASENNKFKVKKYDSAGLVISETELKVGDFFAGGIVAGVFNPNGVTCLGNKTAHGGMILDPKDDTEKFVGNIIDSDLLNSADIFNQLNSGNAKAAAIYNSVYSPDGYGFTLPNDHNKNCDSWLLIVSPYPTMIEIHKVPLQDITGNDTPLYAVRPKYTIETEFIGNNLIDADSNHNIDYYKKIINGFVFSAGNTSFCPVFNDLITGNQSFTNYVTEPVNECVTTGTSTYIRPNRNYDDGGYGTLPVSVNGVVGSTYWGNTTTFDTCVNVSYQCQECELSPHSRSGLGNPLAFSRNTGYFHRNWGIRNCCRLFSSDMANYYLRDSNFASNFDIQNRYKGPYSGFTALFTNGTGNYQTTIAEATSVYNGTTGSVFAWDAEQYGYPGSPSDTSSTFRPNPGYYGPEYMRDQGYPQVSRWYVPSIDELAFIAAQCQDTNINLQTKITNFQGGIEIGKTTLFTGASGWVWSSTGTFNEGNTGEYIQATGGQPFINSNIAGTEIVDTSSSQYYDQVLRDQFTKAWALKFASTPSTLSQYRVRKQSDTFDKAELRLVRMIRCDNRYFKNEGTVIGGSVGVGQASSQSTVHESLKNNCWAVPRLTASAIANGSQQTLDTGYSSGNRNTLRNKDFNFSILNTPPS